MTERRNGEPPPEPEDDFFREDEHDGWAPIERRRPLEPPPEPS